MVRPMTRARRENLNTHPVFILGGLIYSTSENATEDFGIIVRLNNLERI